MVGENSLKNDQGWAGRMGGVGVALLDHETCDIWGWPWFSELLVELSMRVLP